MPDVFISYARRDSEEFVRRLTKALEGEGLDVWVDLDDIPAASGVPDVSALLALADERITREPTARERAEFLNP